MAGFGNALLSGAQARYFVDRNNSARALETGRQEALPDVPAALGGDPDAIGRVAQKSPDMLSKIAPILARLDAHKAGKVKAAADFTAGASNAILNAPEAERGVLYKHYLSEAGRLGHDVSRMSPDYTPETESRLRFARDQAIPIQAWFTQQGKNEQPQPMGGAIGGGAAPGPDFQKSGQEKVSYLTNTHGIPPVAAAGIVGGLYQESKFNPTVVGDKGTAFGQAQWRLDRQQNLHKFAQSQGKPSSDPNVQLDFIVREMRGGDMGAQRAYALLQQAKTPEEASTAMMHFFRPEGYTPANPNAGHGYANRVQYTRGLMPGGGQPQGDPRLAQADAGQSGSPAARGVQLPPGARMMGVKGVPVVKDGTVLIQKPDGTMDWVPLPQRKEPNAGGPQGTFAGVGMEAQSANILENGDPSTFAYAQAYARFAAPRTTVDDQGRPVTIQPPIGHIRPPTYRPPGGGPAPVAQAAAPAPGTAVAPGVPPRVLPGGQTVTVGEGAAKGPSSAEVAKLRTARTEAAAMVSALDDYQKSFSEASTGERARSAAGFNTTLNTSFSNAALLAKGEQLYNLGVLNGPDLEIIRRTLTDPSTIRSFGSSTADTKGSVGKIIDLIQTKLAAQEEQLGLEVTDVRAMARRLRATQPGENGGAEKARDKFDAEKAAPASLPKVGLSGEGYDAIKPGQQYIGPDGQTRTKRGG